MKKVFLTIFAMIVIIALAAGVSKAYTDGSGDFTYTVSASGAVITKYNGNGTAVAIPETLGKLPVTGIGAYAFEGCTGLTGIIVPCSVTSIGDSAFKGCTGLTYALFMGNTPATGNPVFSQTAAVFKVYYLTGKTGFSTPWQGCETGLFAPAFTSKPVLPTTGSVTVKITFPAVSVNNEYRLSAGDWTVYSAPLILTANETVYARCFDFSRNSVTGTAIIGNIDKKSSAAPANFDSSWSNNSNIKLNWSSVPDAEGYVLYRYNPAAKTDVILKVTTATSFTDTNLVTGITYYYTVRTYHVVTGINIYGNPTARLAAKAIVRAAPSVIVYNGNRNRAEIAFTFDDSGPALGKILDICNKKGIKATFFLLTAELRANPKRWQEAVKEGHLICNHSTSHRMDLGKLSEGEIRKDIIGWEKACKEVLGIDYFNRMKRDFPYFRAPGGNSTKRLQQVLGDLGYKKTIYWTREDIWFKTHNPHGMSLVQNYLLNARNGDIFLMHGGSRSAVASVIDGVRAKHYHIVLLSELLR